MGSTLYNSTMELRLEQLDEVWVDFYVSVRGVDPEVLRETFKGWPGREPGEVWAEVEKKLTDVNLVTARSALSQLWRDAYLKSRGETDDWLIPTAGQLALEKGT